MTVPELFGWTISTSSSVWPTRTASPLESDVADEIWFPFTNVPFEDPASSISIPSPEGLATA
jgi:hypothetical protein